MQSCSYYRCSNCYLTAATSNAAASTAVASTTNCLYHRLDHHCRNRVYRRSCLCLYHLFHPTPNGGVYGTKGKALALALALAPLTLTQP